MLKLKDTKKWKHVFGMAFVLLLMQLTNAPYGYYALMFTFFIFMYFIIKGEKVWFVFSRFFSIIGIFFITVSLIYYYYIGIDNILSVDKFYSNIGINGTLILFKLFKFHPYHYSPYSINLP